MSGPLHLLMALTLAVMLAACGSTGGQETPTTAPGIVDPDVVDPEDTNDQLEDGPSDPVINSDNGEDGSSDEDLSDGAGPDDPGDEACPEDQDPTNSPSAQESETAMVEPTAGSCEQPGPDQDAGDAVSISVVRIGQLEDASTIDAHIELTNHSDHAQHVISPTSVRPRIDDVDGTTRLSYLRANFTHDGSHVDVDSLGDPHEVTIAAGETLTMHEPLAADIADLDHLRICVEVRAPAPEGSPAANAATGDERPLMPNDIGFGPGSTVPLICSEPSDIDAV